MGKLSGVVGDSVRFYFEMLSKGTLAEGAILSIEEPPARLQCRSCSSVFVPEDFDWACPDCHGHGMEIVSGRECSVDSIEVE